MGKGPTTWNCTVSFFDNENVTFIDNPKWVDNPENGYGKHKYVGLAMGGVDGALRYSWPGDFSGLYEMYSACSTDTPSFKTPDGVTQVTIKFHIEDGPLDLGTFEFPLTLPYSLPR